LTIDDSRSVNGVNDVRDVYYYTLGFQMMIMIVTVLVNNNGNDSIVMMLVIIVNVVDDGNVADDGNFVVDGIDVIDGNFVADGMLLLMEMMLLMVMLDWIKNNVLMIKWWLFRQTLIIPSLLISFIYKRIKPLNQLISASNCTI